MDGSTEKGTANAGQIDSNAGAEAMQEAAQKSGLTDEQVQ